MLCEVHDFCVKRGYCKGVCEHVCVLCCVGAAPGGEVVESKRSFLLEEATWDGSQPHPLTCIHTYIQIMTHSNIYTHTPTHPQEVYLVVCIIGDQNDISCPFEHALEVQGGGPDSPVICIVHRFLGIPGMGHDGIWRGVIQWNVMEYEVWYDVMWCSMWHYFMGLVELNKAWCEVLLKCENISAAVQ